MFILRPKQYTSLKNLKLKIILYATFSVEIVIGPGPKLNMFNEVNAFTIESSHFNFHRCRYEAKMSSFLVVKR
jgi:hypothetical protein